MFYWFTVKLRTKRSCTEFDHRKCLSSSEKGLKNSDLNGDSNHDLCDSGAVLHQLSYQAKWEQMIV